MSETNYAKCSNFFVIAFLTIFINFCTSAPVDITPNAYTQFLDELSRNQCSVPTQVQLPFNATEANNFEYLSSYLEICQKTNSTKRNKEAVVLCKEIFDNVRSISCPPKSALPDAIRANLSGSVCEDIGALRDSVPEKDTSLLRRMTDRLLCEIMCDSEFEKACQVLLWSFEIRKQIANVASAPKPELPNVPGDGGDTNVDSFKQDNTVVGNALPEIVDPENEKLNAEEAKDVNEGVEPARDAEVPEPGKLGENPEQIDDNLLVPSVKGKQEKPVPNDNKDAVSENQAVPKDGGQDSTGASTSTSSTKTPSSVTQQKPNAQASNTEVKPVEITTKSEGNSQNTNKQLQSDVTKHDDIHAGAELPQGSNTNTIPDEQSQDVHDSPLADGAVQDKKDTDIPLGDEDNNPGNEIPGEMPETGDNNADFLSKNDLPHESANEKSPNDAAADLPNNEPNPSNLVNNIEQNKLPITTSNDDSLAKKTNSSTTSSQTTKDITQQQETTRDKTSIAGDETKADKPVTDSGSRKVEEIQDHTKTDSITPDLANDGGTNKPSSDQKKPKVAQQTEEFDNTIPDNTEKPVISDQKQPEKSQKLKPTAVNPDAKSVVPSSLTETSTKPTAALEKMEGGNDGREPADEEGDHYGDQENTEGEEYPVPDYDGGFGEVSKNKPPNIDVPGPITSAKEPIGGANDRPMEFSRNRFGQDSSDIQMISTFPEQEDGHFFFYFLSIVLILMAGYLIFHNKQKIIALIVEGRHERNRRSHRIGYKKLETK